MTSTQTSRNTAEPTTTNAWSRMVDRVTARLFDRVTARLFDTHRTTTWHKDGQTVTVTRKV